MTKLLLLIVAATALAVGVAACGGGSYTYCEYDPYTGIEYCDDGSVYVDDYYYDYGDYYEYDYDVYYREVPGDAVAHEGQSEVTAAEAAARIAKMPVDADAAMRLDGSPLMSILDYDEGYDVGYGYGYADACEGYAYDPSGQLPFVWETWLDDVDYNDGLEYGYADGYDQADYDGFLCYLYL